MSLLRLDIYSHNFSVSDIAPSIRYAVESFARKWIQYGFIKENGRWIRQALRIFASITKDKQIMRFHINQLNIFYRHMGENGIDDTMMEIVVHNLYIPESVEIPMREGWVLRDYQVPVVDYLIDNKPPISKFVAIQTGKGKGMASLKATSIIGKRTVIAVRAMYLEKWQKEILEKWDIDFQDLIVIRGATQLINLIELAVNDELDAKAILISNKTLLPWFKLYEQFQENTRELGYQCMPYEFFEVLKAGNRIIDEVHQDFHFNFKLDTYTHIPKSMSLSATLEGDDDFINRMYQTAYPLESRYQGEAYHKYVDSIAIIYKLQQPNKIRCKDYSRKTYSHHLFEQSITKYKPLLEKYLNLIHGSIKAYYEVNRQPGDRLLIYCAGVDFCTMVVNYLKDRMPGRDIRRYVEDDPFDNLLEAEILVSTLLSAGTAVDIPGLTTVILTTAINSSQGNVQGFGRLREIKGRKLTFVYFVCESIPKHIEYHERKKVILETRALSMRTEYYPIIM